MPRLDAERVALWRRLGAVTARLQREIDRALVEAEGMSLAWFEALSAIRAAGRPVRVHELCEALDEVPSSLSRRLDRMEEEGLVERTATPLPDDRRAVTVALTPHGRAVWREANVSYRRLVQQHFSQYLTETDLAALQRVFGKLG